MGELENPGQAERRGHPGRWAAGALGVAAVAAGATYGVGYAMAGDKLPRHATVAGVAVGGVDETTAENRLRSALEPAATAPMTLSDGKHKAAIAPAQAGLSIDYAATVRQAGAGKSFDPRHIWNVLRGGGDLQPVVTVDKAKLSQAVATAAPAFATKPVDATLTVKDAKPVVTASTDGTALDQDKAATAVRQAWRTSTQVSAPTTTTAPTLTTEAANKAVTDKLTPALSGITVKAGTASFTIGPKQAAAVTTVKPSGTGFDVQMDGAKLFALTADDRKSAGLIGGKDARWEIQDGKPALVPAVEGQGISQDTFTKQVIPALLTPGTNRSVTLPVEKTQPELSTAAAAKLGVKEVTGEFTTYFPYAEYRNTNLTLAAASINNSFLKPGETFSLNDTLGPKGPGSGYVDGWVINGDHLEKENAGGVSQSATTTFNAIFFAGLEDVEHHPHTMYFDRYPAGREATVYYGSLDLRFRNNTPYGVLMQAYVDKAEPGGKGSITVRVWSTKTYDVKSSDLEKSDFTDGTTIHSSGDQCHAQSASQGFTVNYSRLFYKGGALVKSEPFQWTYQPTDEIICG